MKQDYSSVTDMVEIKDVDTEEMFFWKIGF